MTGGFKDVYSGRDGCITSSSLEYMEIHPLYPTPESTPTHPTPETQPDQKDGSKDSPKAVNVPARPPSSLGAHSWTSASKEPSKDTPPSPWYKLTNGELCPPRHVSAFQPDSSYLKKATIPSIPFLIVNLNPRKLQSGQATQRQVVAHLAVWVAKNPTAHLFSSSNLNPRNLQSGQAAQHQAVSRLAARMNPTAFITASSSLPWASGRF